MASTQPEQTPPCVTTPPPPPPQLLSDTESQPAPSGNNRYARFTKWKRIRMVAVLCYYTFLTPISSTAIFVATPEVVFTFQSTPTIVNLSNALFFVFMALGPLLWGPLAQVVGRRPVLIASSILMAAFSAGTAAAPSLAAYFVFRMLSAFQATAILVVGSVVIGDIYEPKERGRAISAFLAGAFIAPAIAPVLGGVCVTISTWRTVFWAIALLTLICTFLVIFIVEETAPAGALGGNVGDGDGEDGEKKIGTKEWARQASKVFKPGAVIRELFMEPSLRIAAIAVSAIIWNQYSMLAPIRYVINQRFGLSAPLESTLFFLPPAGGCITGAFFGGWWSDYVASSQEKKRGRRIPEDRLKSSVWLSATLLPGFTMLYGWSVQKEVGGIALIVVALFLQGFTQMLCLPGLNTYVVEAMQDRGMGSIAVAGNYLARFMFAAAGTAACLPAINSIGVGWFSTISALFIIASAGLVLLLTIKGEEWRNAPKKDEAV